MMPPFRTVLIVVEQLGQLTHPCRIVVISMYAEKAEIARFRALNVDGYRKNISRKLPFTTQTELYEFLETLEG